MQWGSFGLLCAILISLGWFVRWLAREFFGNLLGSMRELVSDQEALRLHLDALRIVLDQLRAENTAWHERIERTVKEGRRLPQSTSTMQAVPRPRLRSDPRREPDDD
jgi:hypothetical protein